MRATGHWSDQRHCLYAIQCQSICLHSGCNAEVSVRTADTLPGIAIWDGQGLDRLHNSKGFE